ncbi:HAMP domain-containing protein [Paraburkholderia dipogonis]|uniref:HAMP domain-containing protein n=2 Tax=Paraburkholderia dipogonis TaxID=1211383 RepID=A0A4Y8MKM0_9BURK|nr:HAMP domain-containing protein [Paraburkholderia dipogonis]
MRKWTYSIRFQVVAVLGLCGALMATIGIFGVFGLYKLNKNAEQSYSINLVPLETLSELRSSQYHLRLQLARALIFRDVGERKAAFDELQVDLKHIDKAWSDYHGEGASEDKGHETMTRIAGILDRFKLAASDVLSLVKADDAGTIEAVKKLIPIGNELGAALDEESAMHTAQAKQFMSNSENTYQQVRLVATALALLGIAISTSMSVYLSRAISRPLDKALTIANRIADGNLENNIPSDSQDEFGRLMEALGRMDRQLTGIVRGIKSSAESVMGASREIAMGNADLSARTEQQAASLQETASSMAELTETVKQNADNARLANTLAARASEVADAGNQAVQSMVGTIERISGSSSKISEITGVIEGIAFQTNILALNAAVEAARAGEQGRGFAVVASEVRSLAQRSASAAREIKELIRSSVEAIRHGAAEAVGVSATMNDVKLGIKEASDIVGEIATASAEQSRGIEQVNQAISQMDDVTQQNAALVEQAAAAAHALEEQATHLQRAVAAFRDSSPYSPAHGVLASRNDGFSFAHSTAAACGAPRGDARRGDGTWEPF